MGKRFERSGLKIINNLSYESQSILVYNNSGFAITAGDHIEATGVITIKGIKYITVQSNNIVDLSNDRFLGFASEAISNLSVGEVLQKGVIEITWDGNVFSENEGMTAAPAVGSSVYYTQGMSTGLGFTITNTTLDANPGEARNVATVLDVTGAGPYTYQLLLNMGNSLVKGSDYGSGLKIGSDGLIKIDLNDGTPNNMNAGSIADDDRFLVSDTSNSGQNLHMTFTELAEAISNKASRTAPVEAVIMKVINTVNGDTPPAVAPLGYSYLDQNDGVNANWRLYTSDGTSWNDSGVNLVNGSRVIVTDISITGNVTGTTFAGSANDIVTNFWNGAFNIPVSPENGQVAYVDNISAIAGEGADIVFDNDGTGGWTLRTDPLLTFTALSDTPSSHTANKLVSVNSGGTALEETIDIDTVISTPGTDLEIPTTKAVVDYVEETFSTQQIRQGSVKALVHGIFDNGSGSIPLATAVNAGEGYLEDGGLGVYSLFISDGTAWTDTTYNLVNGDRLIFVALGDDSTNGSYSGGIALDIFTYEDDVFTYTSHPQEGWVTYADYANGTGQDALFVDDGTAQWELRSIAVVSHPNLSDLEGTGAATNTVVNMHQTKNSAVVAASGSVDFTVPNLCTVSYAIENAGGGKRVGLLQICEDEINESSTNDVGGVTDDLTFSIATGTLTATNTDGVNDHTVTINITKIA